MPINHIVLIKLKPEFIPTVNDLIKEVDASLSKVPFGSRAVVGLPMVSARAGGFHLGIYREFKDMEDLNGYIADPNHMSVVRGALGKQLADMVVFQIDTSAKL